MFSERLTQSSARIAARFDEVFQTIEPGPLKEAMRYALQGGKGLRGFLVLETAELHGADAAGALNAAAAIEAIHAYSLVHDDLPCMDDDDMRRGRPTVHIKWDEATAVLVGDALQSLAFELLSDPATHPEPAVRVDLMAAMATGAGANGMVLGQMQDIAAETAETPLTIDQITVLQANKTGALIRWSAEAGARLAGADPAPMRAYATALGLAFQIVDDILDVEGDAETAGKRLQKDAEAGKATFVSLLGLDGAKARARELVEQAEAALEHYGARAGNLRDAARFVISRDK